MMTLLFLAAAASPITVSANAPAASAGAAKWTAKAEFLARNYPAESRKRGEQGRVAFQLGFDTDGNVASCVITQSSGFRDLDNGTCDLLARSARAKIVRDSEGRSVTANRTGYIDWQLPGTEVKLAQAKASGAGRSTDSLICRRTAVTGSIAKKIKRCMSRSEWSAEERAAQGATNRAISSNRCNEHGCD
jgi:TonB family protein